MRINSLSLPHPVLGIEDDARGSYDVSPQVSLSPEKVKLALFHKLSNNSLEKIIKNNEAVFNVEVHCPSTLFRKSFLSSENSSSIEIPTMLLRNMVYVYFYITSTKDQNNYQIEGANSDYGDFSFEIKKGDVLAWGGSMRFPALKDWRALKAADSFLEIENYSLSEGPARIILSQNKIVLELPQNDYEQFKKYRKNKSLYSVLHASIVYSVILFALTKMKENPEEYKGLRWYEMLKFMKQEEEELQSFDWDSSEQIPFIAQHLLANPISRMLKSFDILLKETLEG